MGCSSEVVGADLRVASLVEAVLRVDLREGREVLRIVMVRSMAASSSGEAASAGSWFKRWVSSEL